MADFSVHYLFLKRLGFEKVSNDSSTVHRVMGSSSVWVRVYDSSTYGWDSYDDHTIEIYFGDLGRTHGGWVSWPDLNTNAWNHKRFSVYNTVFENESEIKDLIDSVIDDAMTAAKEKMAAALEEYNTIVGITW